MYRGHFRKKNSKNTLKNEIETIIAVKKFINEMPENRNILCF